MTQLQSLAWKEWRETRAFLWIGIGVFLGLPIIGALEALRWYTHRFEITSTPWVLTFGGVLAVFVAVGATTRDFNGRLPDFWQSRPVNIVRWLLVKYAVGLLVVLVSCAFPICVELFFSRQREGLVYLVWLPFMWMAMYTLAFLAGVLVRRMAHAAMLGLAAMLLVYFLPLVLPPLEWMNVVRIAPVPDQFMKVQFEFTKEQFEFAAGMLGVAGAALFLTLLAARRDWRIQSGQMMIYGSISTALLILFSSAAFQLGSNLPVLQQTDLPANEVALRVRWENGRGSIVTRPGSPSSEWDHLFYHALSLTPSGIELGSPIPVDYHFAYGWNELSPENHPEISYFLSQTSDQKDTVLPDGRVVNDGRKTCNLGIAAVGRQTREDAIPLWVPYADHLWIKHDRLYVIGPHLFLFDISDPLHPRLISDTPFNLPRFEIYGDRYEFNLPSIPGLSAHERLEASFRFGVTFKDDILCGFDQQMFYGQRVYAYRLASLTDTKATFERISENQPTMLERMFGTYQIGSVNLQNGLLYESGYPRNGFTNPHVTVLDVANDRQIRVIGHFAAPGAEVAVPLPDGRCLVAGTKVWLVGPPPRRGDN